MKKLIMCVIGALTLSACNENSGSTTFNNLVPQDGIYMMDKAGCTEMPALGLWFGYDAALDLALVYTNELDCWASPNQAGFGMYTSITAINVPTLTPGGEGELTRNAALDTPTAVAIIFTAVQ